MKNEVMIVWATDNRDTILNTICLYALNAKVEGWFDDVTLVVWGASQQVASEDEEIIAKIKEMIAAGVKIVACKKYAENKYIESHLESCGIEVFYTGKLISDWAKSGKPLMTF